MSREMQYGYGKRGRHYMDGRISDCLYRVGVAGLIIVIAFCITGTVSGQEYQTGNYQESYYDELETQYRLAVSEQLEKSGLYHSGMMLTKVTESDGSRHYQLQLHHSMAGTMSQESRNELSDRLKAIPFADASCKVDIIWQD